MLRLALVLVAALAAAPAVAAPLTWFISGRGSGTLDGAAWDGRFTFVLKGDTRNFEDRFGLAIVDPLEQATLRIYDGPETVIGIPTRLGFNHGNSAVFFSRSTDSLHDLFDFSVDAPVDLSRPFAPLIGRNVIGLNQFVDVASSAGALTFLTSSDVRFSAVPLPAAAPLLLVALGAVGLLARRRRPAPA